MNKRLKIIRVVTSSECVPWHMGNTLKRIHADFDVCVVGQNVSKFKGQFPGVEWVDINISRKIDLSADLSALIALYRLFRRYQPDIVHSIMPKAGLLTALAGFLCRVPVRLHTFTGQVWANLSGMPRLYFYMLDRVVVLLNTTCLTDSPSQSQYLFDHGISHKHGPLPVLGRGSLIGVDLNRFDLNKTADGAKKLRAKLGMNESEFIFSFIARKSLDKGCIDVLHAFNEVLKRNSTARLLYVGPDESEGELDRLRKSNSWLFENVIEIDRVNNHEEYLAISNVLCLPSYREGFGTIVIDAAALSIPTIGSDIVGLVDSIEDGKTGILFPAGNIKRLAEIMLLFSKDQAATQQMGLLARKRVEEFFSADILYLALKDFYLQAAQKVTRTQI